MTLHTTETIKGFYSLKEEIDLLLESYKTGSHLQNYLYFTYAPVYNYAESIIILCNNKKYNAASALLRSLIEVHINILYHQVGDSERKLALSAKSRFDQLKKAFSGLRSFIEKYPIHASSEETSVFNKEYLEKALLHINSSIANIVSSNKIKEEDSDLGLIDKAINYDKVAKIPEANQGYCEQMYHLIYRQLSAPVHLDVLGLENFVDKNEDEKYINIERYEEEMLIGQAVSICVALTKDLYENKILTGNIPDILYEVEKLVAAK